MVTTFEMAEMYKMAVAELCPHYICMACATIMAHIPPYIYLEMCSVNTNCEQAASPANCRILVSY